METGAKRDWPEVNSGKKLISSTDYPQAGVTHDERSHTKRIKSFCQQLRQVEMKDGTTDGGEEER